jgi:protease I
VPDTLKGKKVAILATDGVEQVEFTKPRDALLAAGATVDTLSIKSGSIQGFNHLDKGDTFPVDLEVSDARADDYDALVLPGGVANPDALRMDAHAVSFVRSFFDQRKPVAAICHAPWLLIEAEAVRGRTVTSWPSLRTDLRNAGGDWVDREVVVDDGLVTSRKPDDLPAFCEKAVEEIAEGAHVAQHV